jgi:cell division septum initiation protein DivIVA
MRMPEPVAPPSDGVFTVGRRGYDPHQVDAHLRRMDAEIRILVADRDAAVDQAAQLGRDLDEARLRADRLRTQVRTMAARPSDVQGMSERMRTMLRLAEDEVADMLRRADEEVARRIGEAERSVGQITEGARREAADILRRARADAETTLAEAAKHRAEAEAAAAADRESIAAERAAAEQAIALATARAEHERTSAWAESERRRTTVEEDFSIAMDQRRAEALTAIQAERVRTGQWVQHSKDEATRHARAEIAAAEETARRMIAEAQAKVAELADLRGRIAAQLRGTQAQLGTALDDLAPQTPTDAPVAPAVRVAPSRPTPPR